MKVLILTSFADGIASHHLPILLESRCCEITAVVLSQGIILNKKQYYLKKLSKLLKVGILGAVNGIRMRKWYSTSEFPDQKIKNLEDVCKENKIPFYLTPSTNCLKTIEIFRQADADLGVSLGNGYISEKVFNIPRMGMINIHHEILPEYQNAQSIIWQIFNNSTNTGYTIHKIDKHIDTGNILYQEQVPIVFKHTLASTVSSTMSILFNSSARGLVYVIQNFAHLTENPLVQTGGSSYTTPSIYQYFRIWRNFKKLKNKLKQD